MIKINWTLAEICSLSNQNFYQFVMHFVDDVIKILKKIANGRAC